MSHLGLNGLQELATCRNIEKEVSCSNHGACWRPDLGDAFDLAPGNHDPGSCIILTASADHLHPRNRGDARDCLPSKAQGLYCEQVLIPPDLARCISFETKKRIVMVHPNPIVGDADQLSPARLYFNNNLAASGINGVFYQLLDHRRRPFHHLARGYLVRNAFRKYPDI